MRHAAALLALLTLSCSLVNDPSEHYAGTPIPAERFCRAVAELQCDAHLRCCAAPVEPDRASCVESVRSRCAMNATLGRLLLDERTGYDPSMAAAVLREGAGHADACSADILEWMLERSGLMRVFRGTIAPGGVCTPRDLNPLAFDTPALFSCQGADYSCAARTLMEWDCRPRRSDGSCVLYWDCQDGLRCQALMCASRLPDGAACTGAPDCESRVCGDGRCVTPTEEQIYCAITQVF